MCGIAGRVGIEPSPPEPLRASLEIMNASHNLRGPDGRGIFISADGRAGIAHTRLAILDLSQNGAQPMTQGHLIITFNGEIYNFRELRSGMEREGLQFRTETDTEVVLRLFLRYGPESFPMLRGMFALGLYDERSGDLFLARDRYGIKPLYYSERGGEIWFSSTVKALSATGRVSVEPDPIAPVSFLLTGSIPSPMTTLKGVMSVPPGHYGCFSGGQLTLHRFYGLDFSMKNGMPAEGAARKVRSYLASSVSSHLISDAPLGVFLSGGIDSSLLTALASIGRSEPVTTLSVVFSESGYSEEQFQSSIASLYGTDHRSVHIRHEDVIRILPEFFSRMDQPTIDGVNTHVVSWAAKEAGLKAVLSGMGGDELFCGYGSMKRYPLVKAIQKLPLLSMMSRLLGKHEKKYLRLSGGCNGPLGAYLSFRGLFDASELVPVFGKEKVESALDHLSRSAKELTSSNPIDELSEMEFRYYLLNQLLKDADIFGMAHSVEIRVPFLDHPLVDFVVGISPEVRYRQGKQKALLLDACRDLLPEDIWVRKKQGFAFPFNEWLREDVGKEVSDAKFADDRWQSCFRESWRGFLFGREHWTRPYAWYVLYKTIWS